MTFQKVCQALAPRSRDASSSDSSKPAIRVRITTATKGKLKAIWLTVIVKMPNGMSSMAKKASIATAMEISGITIGRKTRLSNGVFR